MKARIKFRKGVCGILINEQGHVLGGERPKEKSQWQLPQGGIDPGETAVQALHREMAEELGVSELPVLAQTSEYISYFWPTDLLVDSKYGGQKHLYFLLDAQNLNIDSLAPTLEFCNFRWFSVDEMLASVVAWKNPGYTKAFRELKLI